MPLASNEEHRDEAERSERSPFGVVSVANGEKLAATGGQVRPERAARERKCFATGPASATGEGVRGTCATSPGAIRRPKVRCSPPSGHPACSCAQKLLPSGQLRLFLTQCKAEYKTYVRLECGITGIVPTDFHGLARKARKLPGLSGNRPPVIFFVVF